jgi:hypothetical protein
LDLRLKVCLGLIDASNKNTKEFVDLPKDVPAPENNVDSPEICA